MIKGTLTSLEIFMLFLVESKIVLLCNCVQNSSWDANSGLWREVSFQVSNQKQIKANKSEFSYIEILIITL